MSKTYLVKMVAGDNNEWFNTEGSSLPRPEVIHETDSLKKARQVQKQTEVVYLDETSLDGEQIFLAPVVIEICEGEETMLD